MLRQNTIMTIGASAAFGLVAVFLARGVVKKSVEAEYETVQSATDFQVPINKTILAPVVVATRDLNFGEKISAADLTIVEYPEKSIPDGAYTNISTLLKDAERGGPSRRVMLDQIKRLEPMLPHKVSGPGGRRALSHRIQPGMRAATIPVTNITGVAGFILPGDRVDVLFLAKSLRSLGAQPNAKATKLVYQNVKVLAVDQTSNNQSDEVRTRSAVTFELTNEQAQNLHILNREGQILLTLRSAGDADADEKTPDLSLKDLVSANYINSFNKPSRVRRTSSPRKQTAKTTKKPEDDLAPVTVFRGDVKDELTVKNFSDLETQSAANSLSSLEH